MNENAMFVLDEKQQKQSAKWEMLRDESDAVITSSRVIGGGNDSEYLPWHVVVGLLNKLTPGWESKIVNMAMIPINESGSNGLAEATIALTIDGVTRENLAAIEYGGKNNFSIINARKGAVNLAITRAATFFNVGLAIKERQADKNQKNNNRNRGNFQNNQNNQNRNNQNPQNRQVNGANRPAGAISSGASAPVTAQQQINKPAGINSPVPAGVPRGASEPSKEVIGQSLNTIKLTTPTPVEVLRIRSEIRTLFAQLKMDEKETGVIAGIRSVTGVDNLDQCTDLEKLETLKKRIEDKSKAQTQVAAAA